MFRRIFAAALSAGIGVGVRIAALQHVALVPMIIEVEKYEKGSAPPHHEHSALPARSGTAMSSLLVTEAEAHDHGDEAPLVAEDSPWRPVFTWIATTLISVGFALLLVGAYAVSGRAIDARRLALGNSRLCRFRARARFRAVAGASRIRGCRPFCTPGVADRGHVATAAIGLMLFVRASWVIPIGVALPVAPHVIGAPHPPAGAGLVPPELAAAFAARSLGVNATSWALLGRNRGAL